MNLLVPYRAAHDLHRNRVGAQRAGLDLFDAGKPSRKKRSLPAAKPLCGQGLAPMPRGIIHQVNQALDQTRSSTDRGHAQAKCYGRPYGRQIKLLSFDSSGGTRLLHPDLGQCRSQVGQAKRLRLSENAALPVSRLAQHRRDHLHVKGELRPTRLLPYPLRRIGHICASSCEAKSIRSRLSKLQTSHSNG